MRDLALVDAPPPPLEARDLRIEVDGTRVLDIDHLRFDGPGPTLVLGPNGAGKTLLLRVLHGLIDRPGGAPVTGLRQAMVFQRPVLLRRSVAGNLDWVLRRMGVPRAARPARIAALLQEGGLCDAARRPARGLSVGQAQRLAVLRALATEPQVLFLDEPTSALDPSATQAVEALIRRAVRRGTRIVMVTHDLGQARRLAREVVLMQAGRLVEQAPAERFFAAPKGDLAGDYLAGHLLV
jgi:tungstate transport system ATP-binding protein